MKNMKKRRKKIYALILLLVITIGYALISTTLKINGVAGIKSNQWDIHWENVQPNQQSTVTTQTPQITENRTKVSYEVNLELPGDFYEFTVDAKNDGTINAKILDIRHNVYLSTDLEHTTTLPSYIKYSIVYDGTEDAPAIGDILASGDKQTYRIRIEYDPLATTLPGSDTTYKIIDEIDYGQTKEEPEQTGFVATPRECTGNSCLPTTGCGSIGDEFCIGEECFNMITCTNDKAILLAKYNLLVGNTCTNYNSCTSIPTNTEGYGKQSNTALGVDNYPNEYPSTGTIAFSNTSYWFGNVGPEGSGKKYKGTVSYSNEDIEEYEYGNYPYVVDENSYLYQYLVDYDQILKDLGAPSTIVTRLLDMQEADTYFGCNSGSCLNTGIDDTNRRFILNTSFWTGSSPESDTHEVYSGIFAIDRGNGCSSNAINNNYANGIRPVIEIATSAIAYDKWRFLNPGSTGTNQQYEFWRNGKRIESGLVPNLPDFSNQPQTYYFENGLVQYGWQKIDNKIYYFSEVDADNNGYTDGNMVHGGVINISGTDYTFDNDGVCTNNCPNI